uniref:Uncharacterized protein n=1 Tax=Lepeophtheirus salmonis TaxID=72036 RepID=A0A0K2UIB2_LEPSM
MVENKIGVIYISGEIYFHFNVCMEQNLFIYNTILSNILEVSLNFKMMKRFSRRKLYSQ